MNNTSCRELTSVIYNLKSSNAYVIIHRRYTSTDLSTRTYRCNLLRIGDGPIMKSDRISMTFTATPGNRCAKLPRVFVIGM